MKKVLKQVAGVDVAQDELVITMGKMHDDLSSALYASKTFANNKKGFAAFTAWVKKITDSSVDVLVVMEATGIYHEPFAYYLAANGCQLSIVLPNKISNYMRTLDIKTITDKTASEAIASFGLQRDLPRWARPDPVYKSMRQLCRERCQLIEERTVIKNQLHAEVSEAEPNVSSVKRLKSRIQFISKQEKEITEELKQLIKANEKATSAIKMISTVTGVGVLTAASVLGETNGFDLIKNKRQLTSYAGLDIKEKQSGTSIKGKPKISKRGNRHLRKAMHLPALTAIRHSPRYKALFIRLVSKHGIKMKAVVAVQRKLLEMTYTVFKSGTPYDENYKMELYEEAV